MFRNFGSRCFKIFYIVPKKFDESCEYSLLLGSDCTETDSTGWSTSNSKTGIVSGTPVVVLKSYASTNPQTVKAVNGEIVQSPPQSDGTVHMKREIGLLGAIAMTVGSTLGSGIFITPNTLLARTDSVVISLAIWTASGLASTLFGLAYCELGTVVPRSGGEHAYYMAAYKPLHKFWGEVPAFLYAWIMVTLLRPSYLAIQSISFANYVILPFLKLSSLSDCWNESLEFEQAKKLVAVACICVIASINIQSSKLSSQIQIIFTITKMLAPVIVIGIGIYNLISGDLVSGGLQDLFVFDKTEIVGYGKIAVAFYSGLYAYDGWNNVNVLTEELVNPKRNLPLAILTAVPLITVIYVFMNVSYLTVLSKEEMIQSSAVGIDFADRELGVMSFIIPVLVATSIFGTVNGSLFASGRLSYVAARDGHLVDVLSYVHITKLTPSVAILFNCGLGFIMISFQDINSLIDTFTFMSMIIYALAMGALFILRINNPELKRPFRVPLVIPALAIIICVCLLIAAIVDDPGLKYFIPIGFCLIGLVVYYTFVYKKKTLGFMGQVTRFIQCITLAGPSPYKED